MLHVMLPSQYPGGTGRDIARPWRRLMLAVIQTAVDDCTSPRTPSDPRAFAQALAYLQSRDRVWPYSFDNICEAVGLDADGIRRTITKRLATRV